MYKNRKRLAALRKMSVERERESSRSSSRNRSHEPLEPVPGSSQVHASQMPSVARRARLMGIVLEGPRRPSPESDFHKPAMVIRHGISASLPVVQTPRGSTRIIGEPRLVCSTPGGSVRLIEHLAPPLQNEAIEMMESVEDELGEDGAAEEPWLLHKYFGSLPRRRECVTPPPIKPTMPAEIRDDISGIAVLDNVSNPGDEISFSAAAADVRPSTSGVTEGHSRRALRLENIGSDLDSDFDDEFQPIVQRTALSGGGRAIPDDEELEEPVRDAIFAVERAMDAEVDRLVGVSASYDWVQGFESFRGVPETFSGPTPGPFKDYETPYDAFIDIWDKDIIELIVQESNRYAKQTIDDRTAKGTLPPSSRLHRWTPTNVNEIYTLFATFMYMAIDPRSSQDEYWKGQDYLEMHRFKELMSYNRFLLLAKFLHFADNTDVSQNSQRNKELGLSQKLAKLAPVISHLNEKFSSLYNLDREISVDESLTLFKGRLSWVQTIRSKAARFGLKSYELCESRSGYLYKFMIYTGKNSGDVSLADAQSSADLGGKSTKIVIDLLKGLERRGHCVTMDNFYNCPALARYLKSLGFDCLGTLRTNRKNVPSDIAKVPKNVAKGTIISRQCGDVSVIAWKDSKLVSMISTYHDDETYVGRKAGKELVKPVCVRDYNSTMGGVDLKDQKLSMYLLERKRCVKWYIKMFKRLLNVSVHNAFIMYRCSLRRHNKLPVTHREFRYQLAKSLVDQHRRAKTPLPQPVGELTRLRTDIVHVPRYQSGRKHRKRCYNCFRQDIIHQVHSECVTCDVYLCFEPCWKEYHSLATLKGKDKYKRARVEEESDEELMV